METKKRISIMIVRIIAGVLLLVTMTLIFVFSSQNAEISSDSSGKITAFIVRIFHPDISEKSTEQQNLIYRQTEIAVRKTAHFLEYALLGLTLSLFFGTFSERIIFRFVIPMAAGALYAAADEVHQIFVSGRAGQITDVLIDAFGVSFGVCVLNIFIFLIRKLSTISKKRKSDIDNAAA